MSAGEKKLTRNEYLVHGWTRYVVHLRYERIARDPDSVRLTATAFEPVVVIGLPSVLEENPISNEKPRCRVSSRDGWCR